MRVKTITRTISGVHYDNLSMTVELDEDESYEKACVELDKKLNESLEKIYKEKKLANDKEYEKQIMLEKVDALKRAIEKETVNNIPF